MKRGGFCLSVCGGVLGGVSLAETGRTQTLSSDRLASASQAIGFAKLASEFELFEVSLRGFAGDAFVLRERELARSTSRPSWRVYSKPGAESFVRDAHIENVTVDDLWAQPLALERSQHAVSIDAFVDVRSFRNEPGARYPQIAPERADDDRRPLSQIPSLSQRAETISRNDSEAGLLVFLGVMPYVEFLHRSSAGPQYTLSGRHLVSVTQVWHDHRFSDPHAGAYLRAMSTSIEDASSGEIIASMIQGPRDPGATRRRTSS